MKKRDNKTPAHDVLFGLAVGDAVGVPAEFIGRRYFKQRPVSEMGGYGTHNVPPGTFSDDSSLAFCLAAALLEDFNLHTIAGNFINWKYYITGLHWEPCSI